MIWSSYALSFTCRDALGNLVNSVNGNTSINVFMNLQPQLNISENLVVNLSDSILCRNDVPNQRRDEVKILQGSGFGGALNNFSGSLKYYGGTYNFPLTSETKSVDYTYGNFTPLDAQIYLKPNSSAGSVAIKQGERFASLVLFQRGSNISDGGTVRTVAFTWNLYANNNVVIPTGGCDVSARDITVTLPEYPGSSIDIPLNVHCAQNQKLGYYLSGTTTDTNNSIFANTASSSKALGVGVQLMRNGSVIPTNSTISLGTVGTSSVSLGLTAKYARTSGKITAGNVQSIIGVTFVYE